MLLPFTLGVANTLLLYSKLPHDMVIDASVRTVELLHAHPGVPRIARQLVLEALSTALLVGDSVGHALLQLYVWLLSTVPM